MYQLYPFFLMEATHFFRNGGVFMLTSISDNLCRVVVLDISGVYVQIYEQGYFSLEEARKMSEYYKNKNHWRFLIL